MNIILDLDGTILDPRARLHSLFSDLVAPARISFSDYWQLRAHGRRNEFILREHLAFEDSEVALFHRDWMSRVEQPRYLHLDRVFAGVAAALSQLQSVASLHLCTNRQDRDAAEQQLEHLRLSPFFESLLITEQKISKDAAISSAVPDLRRGDWLVGDTLEDMATGHALRVRTCGVLCGLADRETLSRSNPTLLSDTVPTFASAMMQDRATG